jgi:hypothetical protein
VADLQLVAVTRPLIASEKDRFANCNKEIQDIESAIALDLKQKSRIKWGIEGDENTSFFHRVVTLHSKSSRINGFLIYGEWISEPKAIKDEAFSFF